MSIQKREGATGIRRCVGIYPYEPSPAIDETRKLTFLQYHLQPSVLKSWSFLSRHVLPGVHLQCNTHACTCLSTF